MSAQEIRSLFLSFFKEKNHQIVDSASLIPKNDPSLLFVNAGMVPFKEVFLGREHRGYNAAVSAQACLRVGGKHNDFNQVGFTSRHHTFFEMLGNFSFGAYFKKEAIQMAWEFITVKLEIPVNRLWVSVYHTDEVTYEIWRDLIGIPVERISRCGDQDNFWSMGDTGPCGPCTEIFYDLGEQYEGGPPGSSNQDGQRYMEIWNIVFMQYDRQSDGHLEDLNIPCVDTGMGLERISAVMQGVADTFEIDLFKNIIKTIVKDKKLTVPKHVMKILADHARSSIMLVADGIQPGAVGRNYVLRRLIRRALRYAYQSGLSLPCLSTSTDQIIDLLSDARVDLLQKKEYIKEVILKEELQFSRTLKNGIALLDEELSAQHSGACIDGKVVFKLYDTYGFPLDVTQDILSERGFTLDIAAFEREMESQKAQSRADSNFRALPKEQLLEHAQTVFLGYESLTCQAQVLGCYQLLNEKWVPVCSLNSDTPHAYIVLDQSVFYAEGGGQVGDKGMIDGQSFQAFVEDTQSISGVIVHKVKMVSGQCSKLDVVQLAVDVARVLIKKHHSATHILHAILRNLFGEDTWQKGSWVDDKRLRFDFSCSGSLGSDEIESIENAVNECITNDLPITTSIMTYDEAVGSGAIGLFENVYQSNVRVVSIGSFSKELCGGTHAKHTGELGCFVITSVTSVSSGVKRIEAMVGGSVAHRFKKLDKIRQGLVAMLQCDEDQLIEKVSSLISTNKNISHLLDDMKFRNYLVHLEEKVLALNSKGPLIMKFDVDQGGLLKLADHIKKRFEGWIIFLGKNKECSTPMICVNLSADLQETEFFATKLSELVPMKSGVKSGLVRGVVSINIDAKTLSEHVLSILS